MQELLPQLDPDYCRSALLLVVRAEFERLRQARSTCSNVKRQKLRRARIGGQRIRFEGPNGGSEVADCVLQHEVRCRFGALPRTDSATPMELTKYVRSRLTRKGFLCPSRGKSRLVYPPAGTVASVDHAL